MQEFDRRCILKRQRCVSQKLSNALAEIWGIYKGVKPMMICRMNENATPQRGSSNDAAMKTKSLFKKKEKVIIKINGRFEDNYEERMG